MVGRIVGVLAGFAFMVLAAVLWRPELLPHGVILSLGAFEGYRPPFAGLAAATALAVALAALQRKTDDHGPRPVVFTAGPAMDAEAPSALAAAAADQAPAPFPFAADVAAPAEVGVAAVEPQPAPVHAPVFVSGDGATAREPLPEPRFPEPMIAAALLPDPKFPESTTASAPLPEAKILPFRLPDPELPSSPKPASSDGAGRRQFLALTEAGDDYRMQGRSDDAMEHYTTALDIARDAHATMPDNLEAMSDLAAALTNVGDVYSEQGRLDTALESHGESLALRRVLAARSPEDKTAQRGLSLGLERLADTREARGHRSRALDLYRESLPIAERLAAQYPHDALLSKDLAVTRENIAQLEAKLA